MKPSDSLGELIGRLLDQGVPWSTFICQDCGRFGPHLCRVELAELAPLDDDDDEGTSGAPAVVSSENHR